MCIDDIGEKDMLNNKQQSRKIRTSLACLGAIFTLIYGDAVLADTTASNQSSSSVNLSEQLIAAIKGNETKTVKSLIKQGASLDYQDKDGFTPLMRAAESDKSGIIGTLLSNKANPDIKNKDGKTALIIAVEKGNLAAVKKLIDTNILKANFRLIKGVKKFLNKVNESNLDIQDNKGYTALMYAVETKRKDILEALLSETANVNKQNNDGKTALMMAVEQENLDCIKSLIKKVKRFMQLFRDQSIKNDKVARYQQELSTVADPNIQDKKGKTALMMAVEKGNLKIVKEIMGFSTTQKTIGAVFNATRSIDAKVDIQDNNGWTALMSAVNQGREDIVKLLLERKYWILSKKKKTDIKNNEGQTALMIAISKGYLNIVTLLIEKGADVNAVDNNGKTPLMFAANSGNEGIVQALLKKKATVNEQDTTKKTALDYAKAANHTKIVDLLIKNGAK